jgi:hypothetical protein
LEQEKLLNEWTSKLKHKKSEFDKISEELLNDLVPFNKLQNYYCFGYTQAAANIVCSMKRVLELSTDERVKNILKGLIDGTEESIQREKSLVDMYNRLSKVVE